MPVDAKREGFEERRRGYCLGELAGLLRRIFLGFRDMVLCEELVAEPKLGRCGSVQLECLRSEVFAD